MFEELPQQTISPRAKSVVILLALAVASGVLFPDHTTDPNFVIIPFVIPSVFALVCLSFVLRRQLSLAESCVGGWLALVVSGVIGILMYGLRTDWRYLNFGDLSYAFMLMSLIYQTLTYSVVFVIALFAFSLVRKRLHKPAS